jgi:transposase
VAAELGLSVETVRKWRSRFTGSGTAGLGDAPRPGRRKAGLVLTEAEREQLARWARRAKTSQVPALRAKIVLACADGRENKAIAAQLRTSEHNVARWRGRFIARRLDGLGDEKRPGRAAVHPAGQGGGSRYRHPGGDLAGRYALVAGLDGPAQRPVGVHGRPDWRKSGLRPHLIDDCKLPADPLFVEKVVDVAGLYHNPPEKAVVLCVDAKSQVQALDRSQPVPAGPADDARHARAAHP